MCFFDAYYSTDIEYKQKIGLLVRYTSLRIKKVRRIYEPTGKLQNNLIQAIHPRLKNCRAEVSLREFITDGNSTKKFFCIIYIGIEKQNIEFSSASLLQLSKDFLLAQKPSLSSISHLFNVLQRHFIVGFCLIIRLLMNHQEFAQQTTLACLIEKNVKGMK